MSFYHRRLFWGVMMKKVILIIIVSLFTSSSLIPQPNINNYLKMVAAGKIDEVKMALPDLLASYPDDPGVKLLHGVVIDDAFKALDIYKDIVKNYPESQWAENAYWRIIQFYAVIGDTAQAQLYLERFRQSFPSSEYLAPSTDIVVSARKIAKLSTKSKQNVTEKSTPPRTASEQQTKEGVEYYGLQVAIYRSKEKANAEKENYLKQRLYTEVIEKIVDDEIMYAVVIGNYTSRQSAELAKPIVEQQCNCKPIILKK